MAPPNKCAKCGITCSVETLYCKACAREEHRQILARIGEFTGSAPVTEQPTIQQCIEILKVCDQSPFEDSQDNMLKRAATRRLLMAFSEEGETIKATATVDDVVGIYHKA